MPHEIRGLVLTIVNEAANSDKSGNWSFGCLLAAQQEANGNSLLGLPVDAVTEGDDDYFEKWIDQLLYAVFGPRPNPGPPRTAGLWGSTNPQTAPSQVSALMGTKVGKGVHWASAQWDTSNGTPPNLGGGGVMIPPPRVIPKMASRP